MNMRTRKIRKLRKLRKLRNQTKYKMNGGVQTTAYVINLDKRPVRWNQIQKDFNGTSIKLERFSAIETPDGHGGAGESFKALIKKAKDEGLESILIMEDDCKPLKHFEKRWNIIKKWLDENKDKWDIFNGGPITPMESKLKYDIDGKNKLYTSNGASALHFILVQSKAYHKILDWDLGKHGMIDWYLNREHHNYIYIDPPLVLQHNGQSNTGGKVYKNFNRNNGNQGSYSLAKTTEAEKLYD